MASSNNYKEPLLTEENTNIDTPSPQYNETDGNTPDPPTIRRLATEFSALSRQKKFDNYTAITQYSSFIPNQRTGLIQIEYEVHEKPINIKHRIAYVTTITLFVVFYILLFIDSTSILAQHIILILSLALSLLYTLFPSCIKIPIPCSCVKVEEDIEPATLTFNVLCNRHRFPLEQWTVAPLCVLLLIASTKFSYRSASSAILGTDYPKGILPWNVLGVLFGLCYLCITLDLTGILKALATKTATSAEPDAWKLFIYIFIFAAVLTCITNNDISIICLTPLVISTANSGNIDADPFIFLVLFVSNTFSMLLVTGNPANLIVEASAELDYIQYAKIMTIPTLLAGAGLLLELYFMFKTKLEAKYNCKENHEDWLKLIKLPKYSIFCGVRLLTACVLLLISTFIEALDEVPASDMYVVLGIAVLSLIIDVCIFDIPRCAQLAKQQERNMKGLLRATQLSSQPSALEDNKLLDIQMQSVNIKREYETQSRIVHDSLETYDSNHLLYDKSEYKVRSFAVDALWEMPWNLIPFVLSLFILVQFMNDIGLVTKLSDLLVSVSNENKWIAMFVVGFTATLLCQCVNNQPMTVLLSTVLSESKKNNQAFGDCCSKGAYFALAVGANLGGNATPIASLAVLMWKSILQKWSLSISYIGFSKRGIIVTPLLVTLCIAVIGVELHYLHWS